jgi:putative FmdB family regulatory protein
VPTYQYLCPKCNLRFDLKQSFEDESVVVCPKCQNGARRLFSPVPIIFKGSGFYVTDNARKGETQSSFKETKTEDKGGRENTVKQDKKEDKGDHKEGESG